MHTPPFISLLEKAIEARGPLFDAEHQSAFRLFNGFSEGYPDLVIDLYASTLLFHNYADDVAMRPAVESRQGQETTAELIREAQNFLLDRLSWLHAGIVKARNGKTPEEKRGTLLFGETSDRRIREHGVWYAIDLTMNRDASFYLDTRNLRQWLINNMQGRTVLNTFAYTGSFGVAALAGGASRVAQLDLNRQSLDVARESYALNGFPVHRNDFIIADFFPAISQFKNRKQTFDCVVIDPPFFSTTSKGKVDQEKESARLINKVRPLINDGGTLVAINNALYVSGGQYMQTLEALCKDGYLKIRELIPVPQDFIGYSKFSSPITDPAPFDHSTKIAILDVKRKAL